VLVVLVAIGLAVYLACLQTLGVARMRDLLAAAHASREQSSPAGNRKTGNPDR
jgi:hypothetical protein